MFICVQKVYHYLISAEEIIGTVSNNLINNDNDNSNNTIRTQGDNVLGSLRIPYAYRTVNGPLLYRVVVIFIAGCNQSLT